MEIDKYQDLRLLRQKIRLLHTRASRNTKPRRRVQVTIEELDKIYKLILDLPEELF